MIYVWSLSMLINKRDTMPLTEWLVPNGTPVKQVGVQSSFFDLWHVMSEIHFGQCHSPENPQSDMCQSVLPVCSSLGGRFRRLMQCQKLQW